MFGSVVIFPNFCLSFGPGSTFCYFLFDYPIVIKFFAALFGIWIILILHAINFDFVACCPKFGIRILLIFEYVCGYDSNSNMQNLRESASQSTLTQ